MKTTSLFSIFKRMRTLKRFLRESEEKKNEKKKRRYYVVLRKAWWGFHETKIGERRKLVVSVHDNYKDAQRLVGSVFCGQVVRVYRDAPPTVGVGLKNYTVCKPAAK